MASHSRPISFADRARYSFDKSMAAGPIALIGWLALVSLFCIFLAALVLVVTGIKPEGGDKMSFVEASWTGLMHALDSGAVGGDQGWPYRVVMFLVTIAGLFIVSSLIGILNTGLEGKLDELRKGRSFVIEQDHTLILGWSSNVFPIISELVLANANQKNPCIVILGDKDKVEMEEEIRSKVGSTGRTRIICRTGSPIDLYDLEIVNPHASKSIVILSPEAEEPDAHVIKSILALTNNPKRRPEPYHIVAVIRDPKNMEAAQLVSRGEAQIVQADDLIARITVQTCRQSGMSVIYTELLDYGGDEIYFQEEPALVGKTFGEAIFAYEQCALMGLRFADGRVQVNPPMETRLGVGDKIIVIAEDDDKIQLSSGVAPNIDKTAIRMVSPAVPRPERTLILGWNRRGVAIISELEHYIAPESVVTVVASSDEAGVEIEELRPHLKQQIEFIGGETTARVTLEALQIPTYDHIIVLGYTDELEAQEADARTLITLLHLRQIEETSGKSLSIVSEMVDARNRELAQVTQADDFIVSDNLISLLLAQVSENKDLNAVFNDLFQAEGSEIYLKPASDYVATGQSLNFYTVLEAARQRGEIALGYRQMASAFNATSQYGIVLNPKKSLTFSLEPQDRIIVLAES